MSFALYLLFTKYKCLSKLHQPERETFTNNFVHYQRRRYQVVHYQDVIIKSFIIKRKKRVKGQRLFTCISAVYVAILSII